MKQRLILLLCLSLALVLTGCRIERVEPGSSSDETTDTQTTQEPEETPPVETEEIGSLGLAYAPHSGKDTCTIVGLGVCTDTEVIIPEVIDGLTVVAIERAAFADCTQLVSITIPKTVERIGNDAFFGCSALTGITIPSATSSIGTKAFTGCSKLTSAVFETPDGWTVAGESVDLSDPEAAANQLRILSDLEWKRG